MAEQSAFDVASLGAVIVDVADAVIVVDATGTVRYANEAVSTILGYEPSAVVGQHYRFLLPDEARAAHEHHHLAYLTAPKPRSMGGGFNLSAQHRDGYVIGVEIALVPLRSDEVNGESDGELLVAVFLRDTSVQQRYGLRLAAGNDLVTAALAGESRAELAARSVGLARSVSSANACWMVLFDQPERQVDIVAQSGGDAPPWLIKLLCDVEFVSGVASPRSLDAPPDRTDETDEGFAAVLMVPMRTGDTAGLLVVAREKRAPRFDDYDAQSLGEFASTVALTRELVAAREELDEYRSIADHDRIARDLHDTVIQRLFAIAMRLESVVPTAAGVVAERVDESVIALDEVIRDIRMTIFNLRRPAAGQGLRAELAAEVDRSVSMLGFAPRLRITGPVGPAVEPEVASSVLAAVRELISNVARHARASMVDVGMRSDGDVLAIVVEDDGVGLSEPVQLGDGLRNLESRARELGGSFSIRRRAAGGTVAEWVIVTDGGTAESGRVGDVPA